MIIDREALLESVDGDNALLKEIVALFSEDASKLQKDLTEALDSGHAEAATKASHALVGSIANFNAPRCQAEARALYSHAQQGDLTECSRLLPSFLDELSALLRELERLPAASSHNV